ncbi:MAG: two-component system CheB/CheR fusion protein [Mariniblastus sp.]|jgi:two-component system CheB/CheR fusion protein
MTGKNKKSSKNKSALRSKSASQSANSEENSQQKAKSPDSEIQLTPSAVDQVPPTKAVNKPPGFPFPIVGLGASAGGLKAIDEFFRFMPIDSGMAFIVVMHQSADHESLLPELIGKSTEMNVTAVRDGMTVQMNNVYILPPGKYIDLMRGKLHLTPIKTNKPASCSIDHFFCSLAHERKEQAVAIVLSGTGSDGTSGLVAVKSKSGMVMAQSAESAAFDGMPKNAIATGRVDYVLSPSEMPLALAACTRPGFRLAKDDDQPTAEITESLSGILLVIRRCLGHDFSGYKPTTICRRIERRMGILQIAKPKDYLKYLAEHTPEAELLFKDLLINVTAFFRDRDAFETLAEKTILPMLKAKTSESPVRVWVPGCSTGEEAYSIAILLHECMEKLNVNFKVQIFATDLDRKAIEQARTGLYRKSIVNDISEERISRFFTKQDSSLRICKDLRDWLVFASHNVIHDPPFTKLDLISCRNLFIYFQCDLQQRVLGLFHYALNRGGTLFFGTSESIGECTDRFQVVDSKAKVYRRLESMSLTRGAAKPVLVSQQERRERREPRELRKKLLEEADSMLVTKNSISEYLVSCFVPPTVIVNSNGDIMHVHGHTGPFLELAQGSLAKNIVAMARPSIELDLLAVLKAAQCEMLPVIHRNVVVKSDEGSLLIDLTAQQIAVPSSLAGMIRISFKVVAASETVSVTEAKELNSTNEKNEPAAKASGRRLKEVERELQDVREALRRRVEEMDVSNEEKKSSHEEFQSTNEELQSTNEELKTSKEELQSLNEELLTVNDEFQSKIRDLSSANDDMNNLLNATEIATIFLDNELRIKRYTKEADKYVSLIPTDLGRPLDDLNSTLGSNELVENCVAVLKTLVPLEANIQTKDGCWLRMRIVPYQTFNDKIDGLVLTFLDIDKLKQIQKGTEVARDFAELIVATVRGPMLILNGVFELKFANESFCKLFRVSFEEAIGQSIYEIGNGQWDLPALRKLMETILPQNSAFEEFKVSYDFPSRGAKSLMLYGRRMDGEKSTDDLILLGFEETV